MAAPAASLVTGTPLRPRRRGIWITVAVLSAAVIIVPLLAAAAAAAFRHEQDTTATYRHHSIAALRVDTPDAAVTVSAGPAGVVRIQRFLSWRLGPAPQVSAAWAGHTLTVSAAGCSRKFLLGCHVQLAIQVPAGVALNASAGGGVLTATALTGPLHLQAGSGVIRLNWVSGPVWARANDGVISTVGLSSAQVDAAVGAGIMNLRFARPPRRVSAQSAAGVISVTVPRGTRYRVTGGAAGGVWAVQPALVSSTSPDLITAGTVSGSVSVGYGPPVPAPPSSLRPAPPAPAAPAGG